MQSDIDTKELSQAIVDIVEDYIPGEHAEIKAMYCVAEIIALLKTKNLLAREG